MELLNYTLSRICELLLAPMAHWPLGALVIYSAFAGIVMAIVFRVTSNQQAIRRAADGCGAEVLAIKLFQDDLVGVFKSFGRLLRHTGARMGHSVPPMLVMVIPLLFLLSQLALWYERSPLVMGDSVVVQLQIARDHWQHAQHAQLKLPIGTSVEAGPLRDVGQHALFWRIQQNEPLDSGVRYQLLQWEITKEIVEKRLTTSDGSKRLRPVNARRAGFGWIDQILHPGEPGLPRGGPVRGIVVHYPLRETPLFGWAIPWWLTFLITSMLSAVAVKPLVGVKF